jgi:hypothetical protein
MGIARSTRDSAVVCGVVRRVMHNMSNKEDEVQVVGGIDRKTVVMQSI